MDWTRFCKHGEAPTQAFESFINQLFELWCRRNYRNDISYFAVVNGSGGDGGVEAYAMLSNRTFVGVQSKWFLKSIKNSEIKQIKNSIKTAMTIRPELKHYIVCIPHNLSSQKNRTNKTEEDRWNELTQEMNDLFPELRIALWDQKKILDEVQADRTGNIYRYWFEKNEISLDTMKQQFDKSSAGWLNPKYIPSLHGQGLIHSQFYYLIKEKTKRKDLLVTLENYEYELEKLLNELQFGKNIYTQKKFNDELEKVEIFLQQIKSNLNSLQNMVSYNSESIDFLPYDHPDINKCLLYLDKLPLQSIYSFNQSNLRRVLINIQQSNIDNEIKILSENFLTDTVLILGEPGTGKTHGLANIVQEYLHTMNKPALLIQAKQYDSEKSWRDILISVLGISSDWTEDEIWRGLEACASRCDVFEAKDKHTKNFETAGLTSVLICIDGLDESIPWDKWKERVRELNVIQKKYRRLKFIVTSRPYVFNDTHAINDTYMNFKVMHLPSEGDSSVAQLFSEYTKFYNITFLNLNDYNWLRWSIKTPYALRLFCEQEKGNTLSNVDSIAYTISHLLRNKIDTFEKEMLVRLGFLWSGKDHVVLKTLIAIANNAIEKRTFDRVELLTIITNAQSINTLDDRSVVQLLDYMVSYGLLLETISSEVDPLIPPVLTYEITLQPMMDYLLAIQLVKKIVKENNNELPNNLNYRQGTIQMASIILLQDHQTLTGENSLWKNLDCMDLYDLQLFTLANVTSSRVNPYIEKVKTDLTSSMVVSRKIVTQLFVKVARNKNHPLGPLLLHKTLCEIDTVAKRDLFWSVPEYLPPKNNSIWEGYGRFFVNDMNNRLLSSDLHDGLPLLYAWQLTNVDNRVRQTCRNELTKWGIDQPQEFIKLINLTFSTNDPQMKEDLACCALAVSSKLTNQPELKLLAQWILSEVFSKQKKLDFFNSVILYAGRAIVERAYLYGHVNEKDVELARPPYSFSSKYLPINVNAAQVTSEELRPIVSDLSWYILKKGYEQFFVNKNSLFLNDESLLSNQWSTLTSEELDWMMKELDQGHEKESLMSHTQQTNKQSQEDFIHTQDEEIAALKEYLMSTIKDRSILDRITQLNATNINELLEALDHETLHELINNFDSNDEALEHQHTLPQYDKDAQSLLETHAIENNLKSLTPHQLALGFAISFINKMGWNEQNFYGNPNGEKPGEFIGVDIAIMRKYYPATHGGLSTIMQFSEKYTWCAVHEMLGYFANQIPVYVEDSFNQKPLMVEDYSLLLDIPNPLYELSNEHFDTRRKRNAWFLPNDISPSILNQSSSTRKNSLKWMKTAPFPNLKQWINADESKVKHLIYDLNTNGNWVCLYNFSLQTEIKTQTDSIMWINSILVKNKDFNKLTSDFSKKNPSLLNIFNLDTKNFFSSPLSSTYIDPSSLTWMDWIKEIHQTFQVNSVDGNKSLQYLLYKTVVNTTYHDIQNEESSFQMPSKILRELLGIREGDGRRYFNKQGSLVAFQSHAGEEFYNRQSLLYVNKNLLNTVLKKNDYKMVWVVRILREPSINLREMLKNFHTTRDTKWIAFEDGEEVFQQLLVKDAWSE